LVLTAGFVTGRLEQVSGAWYLRDGLFTGRWRLTEFFRLLGTITSNNQPICTDTTEYLLAKNAICLFPDIASTLGGPTTPCDSLSFAMKIEAEPAMIGSVLAQDAQSSLCPPDKNPAFDTCE
jgi:hypothetical protein